MELNPGSRLTCVVGSVEWYCTAFGLTYSRRCGVSDEPTFEFNLDRPRQSDTRILFFISGLNLVRNDETPHFANPSTQVSHKWNPDRISLCIQNGTNKDISFHLAHRRE
jgi:hypothetical protein